MKILLIGEFSGVHNNLKKGLIELGHEVNLAADGDGYREFNSDLKLKKYLTKSKMKRIYRWYVHIKNIIYFIKKYKIFFGNDIVQFISPFAIQSTYFFIMRLIFLFNKKTVYYVCGTDPAFFNSASHFKYFPFDDKESVEYPKYDFLMKNYKWFIKKIDLIIPAMYSYKVGYTNNNKLSDPIPLPGSGRYKYIKRYKRDKKINILHGITRFNTKGSKYIIEALEKLEKNFPNKININIVEKLPFKKYINFFDSSDIIIDQCKSYDYGMNAIYALEHSKIVMSGAEDCAMKYMNFSNVPIINIIPDSKQIYNECKKLLLMEREELDKIKNSGLEFVKKYHNYINISSKFILIYKKLIQ